MDDMMKAMWNGALALVFLPVFFLKELATLYVQTILGIVVASYVYWPDERWLIFPLCIVATTNLFKLMTDIRSWTR